MIKQIIGIFDSKADDFIEIGTVPSNAVAIRQFGEATNTKSESQLYKYPEDHQLFHLGSVDTNTGIITPLTDDKDNKIKKLLIRGDELAIRG